MRPYRCRRPPQTVSGFAALRSTQVDDCRPVRSINAVHSSPNFKFMGSCKFSGCLNGCVVIQMDCGDDQRRAAIIGQDADFVVVHGVLPVSAMSLSSASSLQIV